MLIPPISRPCGRFACGAPVRVRARFGRLCIRQRGRSLLTSLLQRCRSLLTSLLATRVTEAPSLVALGPCGLAAELVPRCLRSFRVLAGLDAGEQYLPAAGLHVAASESVRDFPYEQTLMGRGTRLSSFEVYREIRVADGNPYHNRSRQCRSRNRSSAAATR